MGPQLVRVGPYTDSSRSRYQLNGNSRGRPIIRVDRKLLGYSSTRGNISVLAVEISSDDIDVDRHSFYRPAIADIHHSQPFSMFK